MTLIISIIICTYNRFQYLEQALESLQTQTIGKNNFEILIIDAGSSNKMSDIIRKFSFFLPIRFISAPHTRLSEARNLGIQNASGDIIAFLDDDAIADPEWLAQIQQSFQQNEQRICASGGKSLLLCETPLPHWVNIEMLQFLGQLDYGNAGLFMDAPNQNPVGLNMAFKKKTFDQIGLFNTQLGRSEGNLLSNEEIEFFQKMRRKNLKIYYNPKMSVHHQVMKERITKKFFYQRYYWQGRSDAIMNFNEKFSINGFIRQIFRIIIISIRPFKAYIFKQYYSKEQKHVVFLCNLEYGWGYFRQIVSKK